MLIGLSHTVKIEAIFQAGSGAGCRFRGAENGRAAEFPENPAIKWGPPFRVCDNPISTGATIDVLNADHKRP